MSAAVQDQFITGTQGRLFVRNWTPASSDSAQAPIILFHDSLGSVELWRSFPQALSTGTGRQVVAYDRLGFGRSDAYPATLPLDFIAREAEDDFAVLIRALGLQQFILLGHSVGGGIAVNCAARYPQQCAGLVTMAAQAFREERTVRGLEEARVLFQDPAQLERLKKYHGDKARWVLDAWIDSWLHPEFEHWSLRPVLPEVRCPVLAIHGSEDEYGSSAHPEQIGALSGGPARVEIMAETRHMPHREREDEVVRLVAEFVRPLA